MSRRTFLRGGAAVAASAALASLSCVAPDRSIYGGRPVRFGIVTDCHYADAEAVGTRFYRESLDKLA